METYWISGAQLGVLAATAQKGMPKQIAERTIDVIIKNQQVPDRLRKEALK
jgi:hypothetical protein